MISILVGSLLYCQKVQITNLTKTWNKNDQESLELATRRCPEIYPEAPCLKYFIKKEDMLYNAICGELSEATEK